MESEKYEFMGLMLSESELRQLREMTEHEGYKHYRRILDLEQQEDIDSSIGNINTRELHNFAHAQGSYCTINRLKRIPDNVVTILSQIGKKTLPFPNFSICKN